MDDVTRSWVRQQTVEALQILALPADEQIRVTAPFCEICEVYSEYWHWHSAFIGQYKEELSDRQMECLREVRALLESMPGEANDCNDVDAIRHPAWEIVRERARDTLKEMGWEEGTPPAIEEVRPGVWQRPNNPGSTYVRGGK